MEIAETTHGDVVVLAPDDNLSRAADCAKLERVLSEQLDKKHYLLVLDLLRVTRVSSAALRTLLLVQRRLAATRGALVLCRLGDDVRQILSIAGFDNDFSIADGWRDAAALALKKRAEAPEQPAPSDSQAREAMVAWAQRILKALGDAATRAAGKRGKARTSKETLSALGRRALEALEGPARG